MPLDFFRMSGIFWPLTGSESEKQNRGHQMKRHIAGLLFLIAAVPDLKYEGQKI